MAATRRHLQGGTLALLDHADMVRELISLEQHPLPSGRPRIAAPSGGTDDYATPCWLLWSSWPAGKPTAESNSGPWPEEGAPPVGR